MEVTAGVEFFQKLRGDYLSDEVFKECVRYLTLKHYRGGDSVFNYGDPADSFYIVLRGRVAIRMACIRNRAGEEDQLHHSQTSVDVKADTTDQTGWKQHTGHVIEDEETKHVNVLVKGDGTAFGELTGRPREASVKCVEESWIAALSRDDFVRVQKDYEEKNLAGTVWFLQSLEVFKAWSKYSLLKLSYSLQPRRYRLHQVVYRCNDPAAHIFIIRSGEFKFTYSVEEEAHEGHVNFRRAVTRKQLQMCIKGPSEIFGDDDVIADRPRRFTCECMSLDGVVAVMDKDDFVQKLQGTSAWEYFTARHQSEEEWRGRRLQQLKVADLHRTRINETPKETLAKVVARREQFRSVSETPVKTRLSKETFKEASLFRTEVNFDEDSRASPTVLKQSTPALQRKVSRVHEVCSEMFPFPMIYTKRRSRPPPNFFVNPQDAVKSRYKFRPLVTQRLDQEMSLLDRTHHNRLRKLRVRKLQSLPQNRSLNISQQA
jgi:CRP-like cAMP-binding protein